MNKELLETIQRKLEVKITKTEQVFGGDTNQTYVLHTAEKNLFLKLNSNNNPAMFETEFAGILLLKNSNTIKVPLPILNGSINQQQYLVMEYLPKETAGESFWTTFGHQLAALHKNTNEHFGLAYDNYIGSLPQSNKQTTTWTEFYATQRILLLIKIAFDAKKCDSSDTRMVEKFCNKLDALFSKEQPSLLHGDLWSGNFMATINNKPAVFDPAIYYGHREMDIGMSLLFGGFDKTFYSHYNEAWPLEKDWIKRVDVTQLYPLLVHLNLFGGHYYNSVREILKKYS